MNDLVTRGIRGGPTVMVYHQTELVRMEKIARAQYGILKETSIGTGGTLTPGQLRDFGKRAGAVLEDAEKIQQRTIDQFSDLKNIVAGMEAGLNAEVHRSEARFDET